MDKNPEEKPSDELGKVIIGGLIICGFIVLDGVLLWKYHFNDLSDVTICAMLNEEDTNPSIDQKLSASWELEKFGQFKLDQKSSGGATVKPAYSSLDVREGLTRLLDILDYPKTKAPKNSNASC